MLWLQELPAPHQLQQEVAADWEWRFGIIAREIWDHFLGSSFASPTKLAAQIILVRWSLGLCCGQNVGFGLILFLISN